MFGKWRINKLLNLNLSSVSEKLPSLIVVLIGIHAIDLMFYFNNSLQVRAHHGHRHRVHLDHVGPAHPLLEMVHSDQGFWTSTHLWNEEHANSLFSRYNYWDLNF